MNIMAIALAIFCRIPVEVHGQSFLKKLKQKVGNVVGTKDDTAEIGEEPFVGGDGDQPTRSVTPTDKLQKRRTATATWDEMIAPSRANSPEALLNELPPLPSVESIVYPEETARATYYRKIVAVDMRITELDSIHTCSDEEMIALRDKFYVELADINGITVEEMKSLEDPNLPEAEKERLADSLRYRIEELENAQLKVGEEDELIARRDLLRNSEKLTEALDGAYSALYACDENAGSLVDEASALISKAALISDELRETADIIGNASSLIYDAAERIRDFRDGLEFSPDEYDRIETRTNQLRRLGRKYNADEEGMLKILDDSRRELAMLEYSDDMLKKLEKQLNEHKDNCTKKAAALTVCRKKAAEKLEARICSELRDLSMPSVRFKVSVEPMESVLGFDKTGADEVRFLISANAGMELGRISKIASGGELSRIMLAMKTAFSDNDPIETMVFDEIDTGVSGVAAQRVGEKMSDLSRGKQVLCITHLPQIAALADSHDKIEKAEKDGKTFTVVKELDRQGRRMELARLYGGDVVTETTLAGAEEQLAAADKYKLTRND